MATRRQFLATSGAALMAPWSAQLLAEENRLPVRPIPGTGESLPIVGFGNSQAFRNGDVDLSRQLVDILLEFGGSYIDAGGQSFGLLARMAREQRLHEELFIAPYMRSLQWEELQGEAAGKVETQGDGLPLDLAISANLEQFGAHADSFRRLKEEGLARFVGVARHRQSYHQEMMNLMEAGAVDFVQVNYSILEPEAEQRLLPMAQDLGVAILVNRPFVNGAWFPLVKGRELPAWAAEFDCRSWAQFSLKFILAHPAVTCVLTETSKPHHARDNLAGGLGRLPDAKIRDRMRRLVQDFA